MAMSKKGLMAVIVVLAVLLAGAASAMTMHTEVDNSALEMTVNAGYDGMITYGKAFPVRVTIRNNGEDFEGSLGVNAYVSAKQYDRYEIPVTLPAGAERTYTLAPVIYAKQDTLTAEITKDGEKVCAVNVEPGKTANPSAMLIGVLSTRPQNLNNLSIDRENDTLGRFEQWQTVALTPETFPDDGRLMNSFGMIVTDDIDPAALNERQREVLDAWLRRGHILLCGGGAAGLRAVEYFKDDTGLENAGFMTSDSVTAGLQKSIGRAETAGGPAVSLAELTGAEPLAKDAEGRGLVWRSAAGAGRIYTSAFEAGDPVLNAENLMHYYWQQALVNNDSELYNTVLYSGSVDDGDSATFAGSSVPVKANAKMLPALLIAAGMLAAAGLCWVGLKKMNRQKWMWLGLPVLSAVAVICLVMLSGTSEANQPMAVIAENMVQDSNGNFRSYRGISAASPEHGRHSYGMQGEKLRVRNYDYVDFNEEDEGKKQEPTTLRTCYIAGGENALTVESATPWETVNMTCEAESGIQGKIDASIWMEEDGFHAEIVNGTGYKMTGGHVITGYGYVSVPDLEPGEKAEVTLTYRTLADPQNPKYEDGGLYMNEGTDFYSMTCAALDYVENWDGSSEKNPSYARVNMITSAANQLFREKNGNGYTAPETTRFVYTAVPEAVPEIGLTVDGQPVGKMTVFGQLTAGMKYPDIGRTGIVFRAAGMDMPVRVETDETGMPGKDMKQTAGTIYYHTLSETPTFRYDLSGLKTVRIEKLRLTMENYYSSQMKAYALNAATGGWDEIRLNEDIANPENYLDREGNLYLQFRPATQELYADIPTPTITVEGRVKSEE